MSVKDMIKKSVLESGVFDQYNISSILVALAAALALGILIFLVYRRFYTGVIYSRTFAVTLVGMTVLTCMVTLAISTNVVISLGMVGALSIVRFRTAVKDPMDLLYLFWAITTGITAGAGMYVLALLAAAIMIFMIILFYSRQQRGKIYIAVIHYSGDEAGDEVIRCFGKRKYFIKSKTMRKEKTEMAVEIFCKQTDMDFMEKIRAIEHVDDVTDEEQVRAYLRKLVRKEAFDRRGLIYGMGHAVYSISDPRARAFKQFVELLAEEKNHKQEFELYSMIERIAPEVIGQECAIYKGVSANVDFYSGFVYSMLGIPQELFTPIFAMARIVGWSAHRMEELINVDKIIRPAYKSIMVPKVYESLKDRSTLKIDSRQAKELRIPMKGDSC